MIPQAVYDLAHPLSREVPHSPNHAGFLLSLTRRHGDKVRTDGTSGASEVIVTGCHVGTHVDALGHISADGVLHGDVDAAAAQSGGRLEEHGIDAMPPVVARCLIADIPGSLGRAILPADYGVGTDDIVRALDGRKPASGDALLVRTGWAQHFGDPASFTGSATPIPGVTLAAARWMREQRFVVVGGDTMSFEQRPGGFGQSLPVHKELLVHAGINIIEVMNLEQLCADGVQEATLVVAPLRIVGGTGSPVRPLALVW